MGLGIPLAAGDVGPAFVGAALGAALAVVALRPGGTARRHAALAIVAFALALRLAIASLLHAGSAAAGRAGFITGDDAAYARLSWAFVEFLRGSPQPPYVPPYWAGDAYLFGAFVYFESAVFAVFGPRVLVVEFFNAAFACLTLALVFDTTRRVFGARPAILAVSLIAVYPSLVLWSSLNLKDSLALLLTTLVLWALQRFHARPHPGALVAAFIALLLLQSLRPYLVAILTVVLVAGVLITPSAARAQRVRWGAATAFSCALLLWASGTASAWLGVETLRTFEATRQAMAVGARTAYQTPLPLLVREGDRFIVTAPARAPTAPAPSEPTREPRTEPPPSPAYVSGIEAAPTGRLLLAASSSAPSRSAPGETTTLVVSPGARLLLVTGSGAPPPATADLVPVRPGDVIVVAGGASTSAKQVTPRPLELPSTEAPIRIERAALAGSEDLAVIARTITYAPKGLAYALFAPFPWEVRRTLDLLVLPEMALWYVILFSAAWTAWGARRRWRHFAHVLLFIFAIVGILALVEGNVGTLFRHRAMVIPFVIILASPALASALARLIANRAS